jgi:GNAT superfamily N-acetyltransferase
MNILSSMCWRTGYDRGTAVAEITRAGVKDHGVVTGLLLDFAESQGWSPEIDRDIWDQVIARLLDSDSWLFLVATEGDEPVGLAAVNFNITLYGSREQARLAALIVGREHRGLGLGTSLMESVVSMAVRRGCRELEARVEEGEESMIDFYRRFENMESRMILVWPCRERG